MEYVVTVNEWRHACLEVWRYEEGENTGPYRATPEPSERKHGSPLLLKQLIQRWVRRGYITCLRKVRNRHKIIMWKYKGKETLGTSRRRCEDSVYMNLEDLMTLWTGIRWFMVRSSDMPLPTQWNTRLWLFWLPECVFGKACYSWWLSESLEINAECYCQHISF